MEKLKGYFLTGLVAGFLGISSTLYAGESEIILKDNTTSSGLTVKEETTNTTIARFRGDGNVGIGTTNPGSKLQITQSIATNAAALRIVNGSIITYLYGDAGGSVHFDNSGAKLLLNESGGNVGIGITSPQAGLDIQNGGDAAPSSTGTVNGSLLVGSSATATSISMGVHFNGGDPYGWIQGRYDNGDAYFHDLSLNPNGGKVGIGTAAPVTKLEVNGQIRSTTFGQGGGVLVQAASDLPNTYGNLYVVSGTDETLVLQSWSSKPLALNPNGNNVGIGNTSPQYPLHMGSGAHVTTAGVWTDASSREYKENIRDLTVDEAMQTLDGLRPSRFNYKVDDEDEYVGFIAEDVPELVATRDRKGLSPMDITAVLTKVVQEQERMLQAQQEAMDKMKQEIKMLKSAMNYGVKGL